MYSIPQHAVTNGYWKIENFRAQPRAASRRLVKNESFNMSLPFQGTVVPSVNVPHHQNPQKDPHLHQAYHSELAVDHGPRVEEDEFNVEKDEQDRGQIKFDGQLPARQGERDFYRTQMAPTSLARGSFYRAWKPTHTIAPVITPARTKQTDTDIFVHSWISSYVVIHNTKSPRHQLEPLRLSLQQPMVLSGFCI